MRKVRTLLIVMLLLVSFASIPASYASSETSTAAASPQTYTVVVGAEQVAHGIVLEAFFPAALMIHVGDTVHWVANSNEFHTVTFLAGSPMPAFVIPAPKGAKSPVMANPQAAFPAAPPHGWYNGATFANSGLMGLGAGQAREFNLTFTKAGTFNYICLVHGQMMSGTIIVVDGSQTVPTPDQAASQANNEMTALWSQTSQVIRDANNSIKPATKNADGTLTQYISVGYAKGQIDLMSFFPSKLVVHPGDTIVWTPSTTDMAPHTVTFLNGAPDIDVVAVQPQPHGPPLLLLNPAMLFPSKMGQPLTHDGVYNSGFIDPTQPGPHTYSLKIGDTSGWFEFECVLHDPSGMTGSFFVASK